jgi:hypothetical protein
MEIGDGIAPVGREGSDAASAWRVIADQAIVRPSLLPRPLLRWSLLRESVLWDSAMHQARLSGLESISGWAPWRWRDRRIADRDASMGSPSQAQRLAAAREPV